jgi:hypothetical protein
MHVQALLKYNNFHTLMAFLSAFNNSAVLRLKWTRERLPAPTKKVRTRTPGYTQAWRRMRADLGLRHSSSV